MEKYESSERKQMHTAMFYAFIIMLIYITICLLLANLN